MPRLRGRLAHRLALRGGKGGSATDTITVPDVVGSAVLDAVGDRASGQVPNSQWTGRRMSLHTLRNGTAWVLQSAGIHRSGLTPHTLRHSVIMLALEAGVPGRDIAAWAGHSSSSQMTSSDRVRSVAGGEVAWGWER